MTWIAGISTGLSSAFANPQAPWFQVPDIFPVSFGLRYPTGLLMFAPAANHLALPAKRPRMTPRGLVMWVALFPPHNALAFPAFWPAYVPPGAKEEIC